MVSNPSMSLYVFATILSFYSQMLNQEKALSQLIIEEAALHCKYGKIKSQYIYIYIYIYMCVCDYIIKSYI